MRSPMTESIGNSGKESKGTKEVLLAGVGYTFLRDFSFGPVLVKNIQSLPWPPYVEIEDLSYGPVSVVHKLREESYEKLILVGAVQRGGRPSGSIVKYRLERDLPDPEEIQARVAEAVSGVISLDNLIIICQYYEVLPEEVIVIEVEPETDSWGESFSPKVQKAMEKVVEMIREEIGANTTY